MTTENQTQNAATESPIHGLSIGQIIVKEGKGWKDQIEITADGVLYNGKTYKSLGGAAEAMAIAHGAKDTIKLSGYVYFGVENKGRSTASNAGNGHSKQKAYDLDSLLMSPEDLEAKIKAEAEARILAIREASKNRVNVLKDKFIATAKSFKYHMDQAAKDEENLAKLRSALLSLGVNVDEAINAATPENPPASNTPPAEHKIGESTPPAAEKKGKIKK